MMVHWSNRTDPREQFRTAAVVLGLALLTADVHHGGRISTAEARLCRPLGPAPRWARLASLLPERNTMLLVALATTGTRIARGRPVLAPAARLGGGVLARTAYASLVRRSRPPRTWWRTEPHGWSFPSRHTTHAVLIASTLADEFGPLPAKARIASVAGCAAIVGLSRLRLGVHWPSDVVGGALTGMLWLRLTTRMA